MKLDYNLERKWIIHDSIPGYTAKASGDYSSLKFPPNVVSNKLFSTPRYYESCKFLRATSPIFEWIKQLSSYWTVFITKNVILFI